MPSRDWVLGMVFFSQTAVGVLGNVSLLGHYVLLHFSGFRVRNTELTLQHLTVANTLVILSKGVPESMSAFGLKDFLNDCGCKLLFYVHRVTRGVSIGSTCLLSVFQIVTISPRNSRWARLKERAPRYMGNPNVFCWVGYMLVNITIPLCVNMKWNNKNITRKNDNTYCFFVLDDKPSTSTHVALLSLPDAVCLGLMLWASSSMLLILNRHKQRVQYLHKSNISSRISPESRATKTILLLVTTFVSFYSLSSVFQMTLALLNYPSQFIGNICVLVSICFPTVSPFLLMSRDTKFPRICFERVRNTKLPFHIRK